MSEETRKKKSKQATILGFASALVVALAMIDWATYGYPVMAPVLKSLAVSLPAIGGLTSQIK